ncbi:MAG: hypothetical protein A2991_01730 [Candidatus Terrybacteria bacterium RIFCSPLOWO2_01_FULL_58_14]|uniref:CMP/dCMP-type deaminase domain-containing protein n=2 Tax=Candidatus Terryibacteriota TaxID=1817920 RepID=A0A1G2PY82_9BACT|nr:MAG: hypothetical protein A2682_02145 [Candidatus Terrybacteria bacterium RIFCSPHIGHO2_01_FULL_58_15]OHA53275.1 MAG: hypothetical protein A2991_01730 [Candidatus Terrybacteria bacterium RIFCSPLOWO2_01_FULL_58_14]
MEQFMREALASARQGIRKHDGGPFGACIVKNRDILAVAHNTVLRKQDPTCHAEMNAIRQASKKLGTWNLSRTTIFSTTEPCPMCFGAIHWARIGHVVSGTSIADAERFGFHELRVKNETLRRLGRSRVGITKGFMRRDCLALLEDWRASGGEVY